VFTFIVSGTQVSDDTRTIGEFWSASARTRLYDLLARLRTEGVILVSGDVHYGEISRTACADGSGLGYPVHELTSSGLTHALGAQGRAGGIKMTLLKLIVGMDGFERAFAAAVPGPSRVGRAVLGLNFGVLKFSWNSSPPAVTLALHGEGGVLQESVRISRADLERGAVSDDSRACAELAQRIVDHRNSGAHNAAVNAIITLIVAWIIAIQFVVRVAIAIVRR
jgi:hypothetical protein